MAAPVASFLEPLDVETRLVSLARGAGPLRRTLAAIAGRLVATRAWERLGYARLRDYAFERAGLSGRQLQDLAHVDGALRERLGVERALVDGRITWTKARLLCRVATREDEHLWLAAAERMTARALAREVRGVDARSLEAGRAETDEDSVEEIPRENVLVRSTTRVKGKWHQARFFASCVTGRSVQPWEVAEAVAAEVLSAIPLEGDSHATPPVIEPTSPRARAGAADRGHPLGAANVCALHGSEGTGSSLGTANVCAPHGSAEAGPPLGAANVCALHGSEEGMVPPTRVAAHGAPFLQSLVEGLEDADAFEIDARLRRALRLEQRLHCELGPLARGGLYRRYGFGSLGEFAREWLGMSPRKAEALLRLERACAVCPALRKRVRRPRPSNTPTTSSSTRLGTWPCLFRAVPPHRVPLRGRLGRSLEPYDALRLAPPARRARRERARQRSRARGPPLRARRATGARGAREISLGRPHRAGGRANVRSMSELDLPRAARAAEAAADRARAEILPRFRNVSFETKADGSPVTEADLAAERAIRAALRDAIPGVGVLGEEFGVEGETSERAWLVDPIDGTIAFSRGIPLFATLIALVEKGEPVLGVIDLPMLGDRYVGWRGGGCRRNGTPVHVSRRASLDGALVAHGDVFCFEQAGRRAMFARMAREIGMLRGYTDAFGHAQVLSAGVDAMVDFSLNPWDVAATQILVAEAGGRCVTLEQALGKRGLVFGSPALVEILLGWLDG